MHFHITPTTALFPYSYNTIDNSITTPVVSASASALKKGSSESFFIVHVQVQALQKFQFIINGLPGSAV
jgi:hypothetical protein